MVFLEVPVECCSSFRDGGLGIGDVAIQDVDLSTGVCSVYNQIFFNIHGSYVGLESNKAGIHGIVDGTRCQCSLAS